MQVENWLEWRRGGIGASDAPAIMNVAPRTWEINTPFKFWAHRMGFLDVKETDAMRRGKDYEDEALSWFQRQVGKCLFSQQCFEHPEKSWMRATFDGIDLDDEISVEIKISSKDTFDQVIASKIPVNYVPQVLHQMEVKPTKHHFFCVYLPDYKEGAYVEVLRNEEQIAEIVQKEEEMWKCLKNKTPPELTEKDYIDQSKNQKWLEKAEKMMELKRQMKVLEEQYENEYEDLKVLSEGKSAFGNGYKLSLYFSEGRVDYKKIPELMGVDLDLYRSPSKPTFRFTAPKLS